MKKLLIGLIVLLILMIPNNKAYALEDSFYEGEYIPGEYIKKFKNGSGKYEQLRFFRRKSDNQTVYCIELWEALSTNKTILGYDYEQYNYANLDYSVWEKIMLISYYGYGYENHTDSKWYAVTQFMIWKETSPESNIYFTDTLNGNKIEKYQEEISEINLLIQNHSNIPSFYNQTYEVKYKIPTTIQDTNNVLERFNITSDGGMEVSKIGNNLTFSKTNSGSTNIFFSNTTSKYETQPIVYIDDSGQDVLAPGNYYPIYFMINVNLPTTNIIVNKKDIETNSNVAQGDASLKETKIQLLDIDNEIIAEKRIQEDGTLIFENIGYGTYYIKEVEAGVGYLLNSELKMIEVNESIEPVTIYNQVIKNEIKINKYLRNPITKEEKREERAIFSVYNSKNEKIETITTNNEGIAKITLPYGTYKITQELGTKNHTYIDDFKIEITENNLTQSFTLYSEQLTAKIKIINIDNDSKLPILEKGAMFKIKNLDTNQYIKDNMEDIILTTDHNGNTNYLLLSSGKYQLEQIKAIDGYYTNDNHLYFEIDEDTNFQLDENLEKILKIEISNKKQKTQIEIDKYTEYYINDNLVKTEKDINITIPIYASEDIYSKDGVKVYEKDEQVGSAILNEDKVISPFLIFGNYYIKNSLDNKCINITLNKIESEKVELLDKVYQYEENNSNSDLQDESIIINVPNTLIKESLVSNINLLLVSIGLFIIKKDNNYENN